MTETLKSTGSVAPFTGAWIEMSLIVVLSTVVADVAPFTGAWIEIREVRTMLDLFCASHPSRVRGLKSTDRR